MVSLGEPRGAGALSLEGSWRGSLIAHGAPGARPETEHSPPTSVDIIPRKGRPARRCPVLLSPQPSRIDAPAGSGPSQLIDISGGCIRTIVQQADAYSRLRNGKLMAVKRRKDSVALRHQLGRERRQVELLGTRPCKLHRFVRRTDVQTGCIGRAAARPISAPENAAVRKIACDARRDLVPQRAPTSAGNQSESAGMNVTSISTANITP